MLSENCVATGSKVSECLWGQQTSRSSDRKVIWMVEWQQTARYLHGCVATDRKVIWMVEWQQTARYLDGCVATDSKVSEWLCGN